MSDRPSRLLLRAPAKLNLGLRVLGKRPDGYHEIETLFVAVSLFDELEMERLPSGGIQFSWAPGRADLAAGDLIAGEGNLVVRAARAFEAMAGAPINVRIHLRKSIPVAAGLGGGSADAAATLIGLSRLYSEETARLDLAALATAIGADVPFFLGPPVSFGRGKGERLSQAAINLTWCAIVACPKISSPTGEVYSALDLTCVPKMTDYPHRLDGDGFFAALALLHNDLQDVVARRIPEVPQWQQRLLTLGAEGAYVSGSGPSVFGIFRTPPDRAVIESLATDNVDLFLVRPLNTKMTISVGFA